MAKKAYENRIKPNALSPIQVKTERMAWSHNIQGLGGACFHLTVPPLGTNTTSVTPVHPLTRGTKFK